MPPKDPTTTGEASTRPSGTPADGAAPNGPERYDEEGLPLHREPTLDDVRGSGSGRTIAIGCFLVAVIVVGGFWLLRAGLLR